MPKWNCFAHCSGGRTAKKEINLAVLPLLIVALSLADVSACSNHRRCDAPGKAIAAQAKRCIVTGIVPKVEVCVTASGLGP